MLKRDILRISDEFFIATVTLYADSNLFYILLCNFIYDFMIDK